MGKKQRAKAKKIQKQGKLPFVSICTPTFNRRPFIPAIIKCYLNQDYPQDKMEWIIIDDGFDKVGDLFKGVPGVKYYSYDEKMTLGKKRNLMHTKTKGDIIVYMDDDDYYPPDRVSHAVERLRSNPQALCAGSSEIYIWFKHIQTMYQFGPYNQNHGTAGTFAFRRELLKKTKYNENASLAEEKEFLKNYSIPFVQLDPLKTILVFSHNHNTFDKKTLIENGENQFQKKSIKTVDMFVKDPEVRHFFMEKIEDLLKDYDPGEPKHKPDVLKQTQELKEQREAMQQEAMLKQGSITVTSSDGSKKQLNMQEVIELLQKQQEQLQQQHLQMQQMQMQLQQNAGGGGGAGNEDLQFEIEILKYRVEELTNENKELTEKNKELEERQNASTSVEDSTKEAKTEEPEKAAQSQEAQEAQNEDVSTKIEI